MKEQAPVFGTATLMVKALLDDGARPDPDDAPVLDRQSKRNNFARYPSVLNAAPRA